MPVSKMLLLLHHISRAYPRAESAALSVVSKVFWHHALDYQERGAQCNMHGDHLRLDIRPVVRVNTSREYSLPFND